MNRRSLFRFFAGAAAAPLVAPAAVGFGGPLGGMSSASVVDIINRALVEDHMAEMRARWLAARDDFTECYRFIAPQRDCS